MMNKGLFAILGLALALGSAGCGKKTEGHRNRHRDRSMRMERRDYRSSSKAMKKNKRMKHGKKMDKRMRSEERNMFAK